jgi:hypothetical protein
VSSSTADLKSEQAPADRPRPGEAFHNPTYPVRDHFQESAALEAALRSCDERVRSAQQKLSALGNHPNQAQFVRLYHQMLGARDQISEARRRLPLETGDLYHEDQERYKQAIAALDRLWRSWEKACG